MLGRLSSFDITVIFSLDLALFANLRHYLPHTTIKLVRRLKLSLVFPLLAKSQKRSHKFMKEVKECLRQVVSLVIGRKKFRRCIPEA